MNVNHVLLKKTKTLQSLCFTYFPAVLLSASLALEMSSQGGFLCLGKAAEQTNLFQASLPAEVRASVNCDKLEK